jgi:hypothetical protein
LNTKQLNTFLLTKATIKTPQAITNLQEPIEIVIIDYKTPINSSQKEGVLSTIKKTTVYRSI